MDRRLFLRTLGLTSATALLAACSRRSESTAPPSTGTSPSASPPSLDELVAEIAPDARQDLSVITGSFEQLVGQDRPFAFGLTDKDNNPLRDADVQLHVIPIGGQVTGPLTADFHDVPDNALGLYLAKVDLTEPGVTAFVVTTTDGSRAGLAALEVRTPEHSPLPTPGEQAPVAATPTFTDPAGVEQVCTRQPPCPMHEVSLDVALQDGRPVMLEFATPAYCQTAVCGPAVDVLEEVRSARDWGDVVFLHVEIYADLGNTVAPSVEAWSLPSEPWLFAISRDGTIAARADGPLLNLSDQVIAFAEQIR